jgi:cytochrome c peroxidase
MRLRLFVILLIACGHVPSAQQLRCQHELNVDDEELCNAVFALLRPRALPPARDNAYADDLRAAELGFHIFFDQRWSKPGSGMACVSCHLPEHGFSDGLAVSIGVGGRLLARNSPTILTAALNPGTWMWDGRAASLSSQPLLPLENPNEMASNRLAIAHNLDDRADYRGTYEAVFGPLPDLSRLPSDGRPGDLAYDTMGESDRAVVDEAFGNIGKALEAYMRKAAVGRAPLDAYLAGDVHAIGDASKRGLRVFATKGCIACHSGPALSDGKYYDLGYGSPDEDPGEQNGAFRTPTLRQVLSTPPYAHNGSFVSVAALLAEHGSALEPDEQSDLLVFFLDLTGDLAERPWSNWPGL